jgi:pimeloyl-ACP methyl ester carboxylesterase
MVGSRSSWARGGDAFALGSRTTVRDRSSYTNLLHSPSRPHDATNINIWATLRRLGTGLTLFVSLGQAACSHLDSSGPPEVMAQTGTAVGIASSCIGRPVGVPAALEVPGYVRHRNLPKALVFVHGIWGDGRNTWLNGSGTYWPSLVVNDDSFNDMDVYVYQYPSPKDAGALSIPDLVTDLKTRLSSARVFESHREVAFVAHSMGGVIARGLLLRYRDLAKQVPLIFFYATPTTGSVLANLVIGPIRTIQSDGLRPIELNSFLQAQQSDWLAAGFATKSYCAFETEDILAVRVVSRESATALCTLPPQAIRGDHSDIVKPRCFGDIQHVALRVALTEASTTTPTPIAASPGPTDIPLPRERESSNAPPRDFVGEQQSPPTSKTTKEKRDVVPTRRYLRPEVQAVVAALKGQTSGWRTDALSAARASLPNDLSANEIALLLGSERLGWRVDLLRILVKHAKPRSLESHDIPAILAQETTFREDMIKAVAPYIETPIPGPTAAQILGATTGCWRADCLKHIARMIQRPIAPDARTPSS